MNHVDLTLHYTLALKLRGEFIMSYFLDVNEYKPHIGLNIANKKAQCFIGDRNWLDYGEVISFSVSMRVKTKSKQPRNIIINKNHTLIER